MNAEEREEYWKRAEQIKRNGVPFYPDVLYKDAIMALLVFLAVVFLAVFVGVPSDAPADPTNTSYVPRPEWYFLSLFQLLKYFPGELEWVGVVVVPGALVVLALALPFFDRRLRRHPLDRPLATTVVTLLVLAVIALGLQGAFSPAPPTVQGAVAENTSNLSPLARTGRQVFQDRNCSTCHAIKGVGGTVGPDLTTVGQRLSAAWLVTHVQSPTPPMPAISLSNDELMSLTAYLLSLKSADTAVPPNPPAQPAQASGGVAPAGSTAVPDLAAAKAKFDQTCGGCHPGGQAGVGPALHGAQFASRMSSDEAIIKQVRNGGRVMPAFPPQQLSDDDLKAIISYIRSLPQ